MRSRRSYWTSKTGACVLCAASAVALVWWGQAAAAEAGPSIEEMLSVIEAALGRGADDAPAVGGVPAADASRSDTASGPSRPGDVVDPSLLRRSGYGGRAGRLAATLAEFDILLQKGDYAAARKLVVEAPGEGASPEGDRAAAEVLRAAARLVRALERRRGVMRRALEADIGQTVTLWTASGRRKGELVSVSGTGIALTAKVIINNEVKGTRRLAVAWPELTSHEEDRLAGEWKPRGPEGEMARAALAILRKDPDSAERALFKLEEAAGTHPLVPHYRTKLGDLTAGPVEAAARRAWRRIESRAKGKALSPAAARSLLADVAAFQKEHGGTKFAASAAERLSAVKSRAEAALAQLTGLVGHWRLDEGKGAVARDSSGAGGHGTLEGATWAAGRIGGCLRFDGSGRVLVPGSEKYELGAADFTVAAWIRTNANGTIVAKAPAEGPWARDAKALFVKGGRLHFDSGWVGVLASERRVNDNEWHHVAVTFVDVDNVVQLYVDGEPAGRRVLGLRSDVDGHVLKIGLASRNFAGHFTGFIDDVRVYSRALSAADVAALCGKRSTAIAGAEPSDAEGEEEPAAGPSLKVVARNASMAMTFDKGTVVYNKREEAWYVLDLSARRKHGRIHGSFAGNPKTGKALAFRGPADVPEEYDMALVLGPSGRKGDFAMYFAGKAGCIEVEDDLNSYPIDISVRLLVLEAGRRQYVVCSDRPGRFGTGFGVRGGWFEVIYHDGFRRAGRAPEGKWVDVQLTYTAETVTFRVVGREVERFSAHVGRPLDGRDAYYIGRLNPRHHLPFKGVIDHVYMKK